MDKMPSPQWYLDIGGKQSGPYSGDQLKQFAREGKLLPQHRVTHPMLSGKWITVQDFLSEENNRAQTVTPPPLGSNSSGKPFRPPQRPNEEVTSTRLMRPGFNAEEKNQAQKEATAQAAADPTQHLFDALQAARDRKSISKMNELTQEWGQLTRPVTRRVPPQTWLIVTIVSVLWIAVWGVMKLLDSKGAALSASSSAEYKNPVRTYQPKDVPAPTHRAEPVSRPTSNERPAARVEPRVEPKNDQPQDPRDQIQEPSHSHELNPPEKQPEVLDPASAPPKNENNTSGQDNPDAQKID